MIDFARFEAVTFDCYGTLIDWERGILDALRPVLGARGMAHGGDSMLERFGRVESGVQAEPFRPYRQVLRETLVRMGRELGFEAAPAELEAFSSSVEDWPAFPDSTEALRVLGARYRLAIVSNVDDDLFEGSAERLQVPFAPVVTAQQVRAYKPAPAHFHEVLRRLDLPRQRVLHVAQSKFHDIAPARELGFTTVWVNRRAGRPGGGATAPSSAEADLEVPDLRTLAELAG